MRYVAARNLDRRTALGDRIALADTFWLRLRGLLGRPALREGEGMLLSPCSGVHMFGMKYPLDVLFVDGERRVTAVCPAIRPGGKSGWQRGARAALELPAGSIERSGTRMGDLLEILPVSGGIGAAEFEPSIRQEK